MAGERSLLEQAESKQELDRKNQVRNSHLEKKKK
jgi:hypothetical protein